MISASVAGSSFVSSARFALLVGSGQLSGVRVAVLSRSVAPQALNSSQDDSVLEIVEVVPGMVVRVRCTVVEQMDAVAVSQDVGFSVG